MILRILAGLVAICATPCLIDEILGTFEVFLVACYLIQLTESHLDDGMSTWTMNLPLVRTESLAHEIRILNGHVEEGLLTRSTIVGNGALDEMTRVVEFMRIDLLPLMGTPPTAQARTFICNTSCQVAIRFLSLGNDINH